MTKFELLQKYLQLQAKNIMFYHLAIFIFVAIILFFLFCILFCISLCGFSSIIKSMLTRLNISSYDRIYQSQSEPLNRQCYICLDRVQNQVVTTCNHSFCAQCILRYVNSKPETCIACPACRKTVLVLLRKFDPNNHTRKLLKQSLCNYNSKHGQQPGFIRSITQFTNIARHLPILLSSQGIIYLLNSPRTKNILLMLIYMISPVDFLPQVILGPIGMIDDGAVMLGFLKGVAALMIDFVRQQAGRQRVRI